MRRMLLLAALVVLVAVPNCFGQAAAINGQIEGTVTDPTGAVVPGAAVSIENVNTGFKRELKTDDSGFYRFTVLPLGTYNLKVVTSGFSPGARSGVVIDAGATATVDIQLRVGGKAKVVKL